MAIFNDDYSFNSIIGNGSSFVGDVRINDFIRIDGDLNGNLEATGNVIIGENARVLGDINAKSVSVIGGIVKGNINAVESVKLFSTSVVIGDIQTHNLQSEEKVIVHGHCISIQDDSAFEESISNWQNTQAIVKKTMRVKNGN